MPQTKKNPKMEVASHWDIRNRINDMVYAMVDRGRRVKYEKDKLFIDYRKVCMMAKDVEPERSPMRPAKNVTYDRFFGFGDEARHWLPRGSRTNYAPLQKKHFVRIRATLIVLKIWPDAPNFPDDKTEWLKWLDDESKPLNWLNDGLAAIKGEPPVDPGRDEDTPDRLRNVLNESRQAMKAILDKSGLVREADLDPNNQAAGVADRLLDGPLDVVVIGLYEALGAMASEKSRDAVEARDVLARATDLAVRYLFEKLEKSVVTDVRSHMDDKEGKIHEMRCTLITVAEVIMAAATKRPTAFRWIDKNDDWPVGTRLLPDPPNSEIESTEHYAEAIIETVTRKSYPSQDEREFRYERELNASHVARIKYSVSDSVLYQYRNRLRGGVRHTPETKMKAVNALLEVDRFYWAKALPDDEKVRKELEAQVEVLKTDLHLPALVFLALSNDPELNIKETEIYRRFEEIMRHKKDK
jgi:hypothetical protein